MLAGVRGSPLLKLLPAPLPSSASCRHLLLPEFMNFLNGLFLTKISLFLLQPAAYGLHPKYKGTTEIFRTSDFTLAISSQHNASNTAASFSGETQGSSQQEMSWFHRDIRR